MATADSAGDVGMLPLRISLVLPIVLLLVFPVLWQPIRAQWLGKPRLVALIALESKDNLQALALLRSYQSDWQGDPITSYSALLAERLYADQPQDLGRWRDTGLSQYFFNEASRLRSRGRYDQAMADTELAYLIDSGWRGEWSRALNAWIIGKAYHQAGQIEAAKQALQMAIPGLINAEKPSGREYAAYTYCRLGEIAEQQGENDAAFEYYVQSILISPQYANFFKLSGLMRRQGQSLDELSAVLAEFRHRGPQDDSYLWVRPAGVFRELGALDLAQQILDEVPPELVKTPAILSMQAQLAVDRGDLQIAESIYRSLLEEARLNRDAQLVTNIASSLVEVMFRQNDYTSAISLLEEVTRDMPSVVQSWFRLGQAYQRQGRLLEARLAYQKALELDANYAAAAQSLRELEK